MLPTAAKTAALALLPTTALVALLFACPGCSKPARGSSNYPVRPIEMSTSDSKPLRDGLATLGVLRQGDQFETTLWFRNHSRAARRITGYVSSCECLTISGLPVELAAGASAAALVRIDLQDERSFTGDVEVVVMLEVADGESLRLTVPFTVQAMRESAEERE